MQINLRKLSQPLSPSLTVIIVNGFDFLGIYYVVK